MVADAVCHGRIVAREGAVPPAGVDRRSVLLNPGTTRRSVAIHSNLAAIVVIAAKAGRSGGRPLRRASAGGDDDPGSEEDRFCGGVEVMLTLDSQVQRVDRAGEAATRPNKQ
jgi:hypothetical protein